MAKVPTSVEQAVSDPAYTRRDPDAVHAALARLGCRGTSTFRRFYQRYAGPFASRSACVLLDLVDQDENVETETRACRQFHGFPDRYLVISAYGAGAVLVYDHETDSVFEVDFEGSDQALLDGTLAPRWPSFEAFLVEYFA